MIDLRSDTFTVPTDEMRQVIAAAPVGDDVFGEDPSINELQDYTAELAGKEKGLYVASGVMGNQVSLAVMTNPGNEVIIEADAHIFYYEAASPSIISGVQLRCIKSGSGMMPLDEIEAAIRPTDSHFPQTSLIALENTHNRHGGTILSLDYINQVRNIADKYGLGMHCDGARLWHSCAETGISLKDYCAPFDTVSLCLSKGLGAPVGSVIVSTKNNIGKAHKWRKILGGGMRQAGIIASAGLYAIKEHFGLLKKTHDDAKLFASEIAKSEYININVDNVQTNIVVFDVKNIDAVELMNECTEAGLLILALGGTLMRAVFHFQNSEGAKQAAEIIVETAEKIANK